MRGGKLWPGKSKFLKLIQHLPESTLIDDILVRLPDKQKQYWSEVFSAGKL